MKTIAVNIKEHQEYGCIYCGYRSGYTRVSGGGACVWVCAECKKTNILLADGLTKSTIGIGDGYPELQSHPRKGIPSHGAQDTKPKCDCEHFKSRGIGLDNTNGCFVCGGEEGLHDNIAAYVQCKESGERIIEMFKQGARLDYREYEPDYIQVKIGACKKHIKNLTYLDTLTREQNLINKNIIYMAINHRK